MAAASSLALIAAFLAMSGTALAADCSVDVDSPAMPSPQPVLLSSGYAQDFSRFLLPNRKGNLTVAEGQQVTVACPGSSLFMVEGASEHVAAVCVGDTLFSVKSVGYTLNGMACSAPVTPSARYTNASCGVLGRFGVVEVGFSVGAEFYRLYDVCFSNSSLTTAYAHHTIPADVYGAQKTNLSNVTWTNGNFYGKMNIEAAYSKQNETIAKLLNLTKVDLFENGRLERGALAPAEDFMLESLQIATFFSINSAPRWTQLDDGNWGKLETLLRQTGKELEVYTGTLGVLALDNNANVSTALYLSSSANSRKALAVPKYFWKIVYEPQKKLSAAFVTINNPFAKPEEVDARYRLCHDICNDIDWLTWDQNNQTGGLSFCCDYEEFKKVIPGIPELDVKGHRESSSAAIASALWLTVTLVAAVVFRNSFGGV